MAYRYDTLNKTQITSFQGGSDPGRVDHNPFSVVAIVPYSIKNVFDIATLKDKDLGNDLIKTKGIFQIQDRVIAVSTSDSKQTPVGNLTVALIDPQNDVVKKTAPGDWIVCWMFDNENDAAEVSANLETGKPCNEFMHGLKFLGTINSINKSILVDPATARKQKKIEISASSLEELNATIYFDQAMKVSDDSGLLFLNDVFLKSSDFISINRALRRFFSDINTAAEALIVAFLKTRPADNTYTEVANYSPNQAYLVPQEILSIFEGGSTDIFGKTLRRVGNPFPAISDILNTLIGLQEYSEEYLPKTLFSEDVAFLRCNKKLIGRFSPILAPFHQTSLWALIHNYLNPKINEMFAGLRVTGNNRINPCITIRQIPFTTDVFDTTQIDATRFSSLPRWVIYPSQVKTFSLTKSDATRNNCTYLTAVSAVGNDDEALTAQARSQNPPIVSVNDIKRATLRIESGVINVDTSRDKTQTNDNGAKNTASKFTTGFQKLFADFSAGNHLKYSGSITTSGIQAPVAIGDNLEFDGCLFHIEQIAHSVIADPATQIKNFTTSFRVSNGISLRSPANEPWIDQELDDLSGVSNILSENVLTETKK
jgi:hypothetical protein